MKDICIHNFAKLQRYTDIIITYTLVVLEAYLTEQIRRLKCQLLTVRQLGGYLCRVRVMLRQDGETSGKKQNLSNAS